MLTPSHDTRVSYASKFATYSFTVRYDFYILGNTDRTFVIYTQAVLQLPILLLLLLLQT
jgi:hypothetical protein